MGRFHSPGSRGTAMAGRAEVVGVLFADISDSMRLYEVLGNRDALAAVETCLATISAVVEEHGGRVVKTIGDEVMAVFREPDVTWAAAIAIQRRVGRCPAVPSIEGPIRMAVRIGFDVGPAIENAGDWFGGTVNMAGRMVQIARRGQIFTRHDDCARPGGLPVGSSIRVLDWIPLKGAPDGVRIADILWTGNREDQTTLMLPLNPATDLEGGELKLSLSGRTRRWEQRGGRVTIGREQTNDVVVASNAASRQHATIECRRGRWILIDHSSNGTYVNPSDGDEIHLRHQELLLRYTGTIGFGQSPGGGAFPPVEFSVAPIRH